MPQHAAADCDYDPATDAMIALGGEIARALVADGRTVGLLVLGPKRNGLPYEDEEVAFLSALSSVAMLALHSAGIQQTLERLNTELRGQVAGYTAELKAAIESLKEGERHLKEREERYHATFEKAPVGIAHVNHARISHPRLGRMRRRGNLNDGPSRRRGVGGPRGRRLGEQGRRQRLARLLQRQPGARRDHRLPRVVVGRS